MSNTQPSQPSSSLSSPPWDMTPPFIWLRPQTAAVLNTLLSHSHVHTFPPRMPRSFWLCLRKWPKSGHFSQYPLHPTLGPALRLVTSHSIHPIPPLVQSSILSCWLWHNLLPSAAASTLGLGFPNSQDKLFKCPIDHFALWPSLCGGPFLA